MPDTRRTPIICQPYHVLDIKSAVGDEGNSTAWFVATQVSEVPTLFMVKFGS